ncbi:MAG: hypothetical protein K2Q10_03940 [Rhodospirillales bacterium]|nr:hypothetical protein [Rhodospirillales bacterium]
MSKVETLKAEVRRLNAQAIQAKLDLHDLSEDLPTNWPRILDVAQRAYESHAALSAARETLKSMKGEQG